MSYVSTTGDNFSKLYVNGYTSKEYTLLEKQNIQKIISGNIPRNGMLPACHLNFGNIGKIKFDFGMPTTDPLNMNMFRKLSRLGDIVRGINARCITLIEELKCCQLAELYNNIVIPIFEWVLKDFINTLVSIAEGILKSYQVMKVIFCAVRPVPGNPWLRRGGFDFLKYLYSFVEGFEAVYKWLVDGNPIDMILNPAEVFYKKIASCSPDKKRNLLIQDDVLMKENLKRIMSSYSESNGQTTDQKNLDQRNLIEAERIRLTNDASKITEEINTANNQILFHTNTDDKTSIEYYQNILEDREAKQVKNNAKIEEAISKLTALGTTKTQDIISTEQLVNAFLARRTLDKMVIDAYNPVCSCLLEMAGVHGFSPPNYITLNTKESFYTKADGKILYGDKDRWLTAIKKTRDHETYDQNINSLYVSYEHFPEKFVDLKLSIERNLLTRYANGYALNGNSLTGIEDFGDIKILYNTTDQFGKKTEDFTITSEYTQYPDIKEIYSDSGISRSRAPTDINNIFDLNEKRLDEKNVQLRKILELEAERRSYEKILEGAWNSLRKIALETVAMGKVTNSIIDELDRLNKEIVDGASDIFGGAVAGAKNIYDNVSNKILSDSNKDLKTIDQKYPGVTRIENPTPEQQIILDNRKAILTQRDTDIKTAQKTFINIGESATNAFNKSISTIASPYDSFKNIATPAAKVIEAQIMLDRLGTSFDIPSFIDLYNPESQKYDNNVVMPISIIDISNNPDGLSIREVITVWTELTLFIDRRKGMISRLERLVEIDNFVVKFVDDELQICGCDILCVILQQILDIITSAINALIKTIIDRLLKMVISEQVTYIIKIITEKLKCFLMATEISKNIKKIGDVSKALKKRNEQALPEATDPAGCSTKNSKESVLDKLYKNDEVHLTTPNITTDTISVDDNGNNIITNPIVHPMPDFGTNSPNDNPEPENTLVNNGAKIGDSSTGRNVPSLYLNCEHGKFPNVEVQIATRPKFEILVAFIPGDSIIDAEVISTPQVADDPLAGVTDINGDPINVDIVNPSLNLAEIMAKVNAQVNEALTSPIYLEKDCAPKNSNTDNNLVLCSRDNLTVDSVLIIENDTIVNDSHLGNISTIKYSNRDKTLFEYYPEHKEADKFGMVKLLPDKAYWIYSTPNTETKILPPTIHIVKEIVPTGTPQIDSTETTVREVIESFAKKTITTTVGIGFNQNGTIIEKTITTTIEITLTTPFRKPSLELLINFKNSVNHFKIRALLDVVAYDFDDVLIKYDDHSYTGRYSEYVRLGACPAGNDHQYIISFDRLLFLSTKILKAKYIITNPVAVATAVEASTTISDNKKQNPPNKCLLPDEIKQSVIDAEGVVDNLVLAIGEATIAMEEGISNIVVPEQPTISEMKIAPILKSIPFLVLNKEFEILVQIVNRKIYLQFPVNAFHISEPTIIDYELIPGEIYMFIFNTNGLTFNMSIITADKEIYSASGLNTALTPIQPSVIGGNVDGTASMCGGTILDIIISKNGNNTLEYFNRSMMGYVPRLSQILFDFSLIQGSRVYNTITNITNGYATKIPRAGSLSTEYGYGAPTQLAKQQADYYGTIISNSFYQVLKGYMDNFFCKDNLGDKDFSISFWVYNLNCRSNHHSIISDDIGKNYIYYDAAAGKVFANFADHTPLYMPIVFKSWTNILFRYNKYLKTFYLTIKDIHGLRHDIQFTSKNKFLLMSLFAEYDYKTKKYIRAFDGYLSTISIFMSCIDERTYSDLYKNQQILIRGMEK